MSGDDLLKKDCEEIKSENVEETSNEPQEQQKANDLEEKEPNLKSLSTNKNESNASTEPVEELKALKCSISMRFHDNLTASIYKPKFLKFISSFAELKVQNASGLILDIYRDENEVITKDEEIEICPDTSSPKKRKKHSKAKKELFVVDATPSQSASDTELRYTTKFIINAETAGENVTQASKAACFNCGELHQLKDCPQPKDHVKINMARQKFKFQQQNKTSRYHLEQEKYSHLQPGKISDELRKALGLHRQEVPHYVYLMRQMGYPPGWLEEAKLVHSNLDMFDIDGKNLKSATLKKGGLDESKIVDYPGFNVPFPKGVKDDCRMYRVPPYSENFNKKTMVTFFEKKLAREEDDLETCDMDIDHDPDSFDLNGKKIQELKMAVDRDSPSLVDLENQKQQLLEELNDEPKDEIKNLDYDSDKGFLAVKTSCFGTPLLKSSSPYSSLPNPDNFSKDVSPVINFENLPNSTGKYEQLSDVLQKVRDTMKKVNNCST